MFSTKLILAALLVVVEIGCVTGSPVIYTPSHSYSRHNEAGQGLRRSARTAIKYVLSTREANPQDGGSSVTMPSVGSSNASVNLTTACIQTLSSMNSTNPTGLMGCWNILSLDNHTGMYQGDLRMYNASQPSGPFVGTSMTTTLSSAPLGTLIQQQMDKRSHLFARQSDNGSGDGSGDASVDMVTQVFQGVFNGQMDPSLQFSKLNSTELMALVIPQITITGMSPSGAAPVTANLTTADMAYFVAGVFANQSANADAVANPAAIQAALTAGAIFVMPGQTLGIFPTGLIVTSFWCLMFITAVGLGTVGRIRHQRNFRSRMAATTGKR